MVSIATSGLLHGRFSLGIDTMELSNGCVCCSLADDLVGSIIKLVDTAEIKRSYYDHIVVECSGVCTYTCTYGISPLHFLCLYIGIAEPRKIREIFHEAEDYDSPYMQKIKLGMSQMYILISQYTNDATSTRYLGHCCRCLSFPRALRH